MENEGRSQGVYSLSQLQAPALGASPLGSTSYGAPFSRGLGSCQAAPAAGSYLTAQNCGPSDSPSSKDPAPTRDSSRTISS